MKPTALRLQVLATRPAVTLTEIELVGDALHLYCLDARDHVPTEVRAARPSAVAWKRFRTVLDEVDIWQWPRRWPGVGDNYVGEWTIGVAWGGRVAATMGPLGVPEDAGVLREVERLVGTDIAGLNRAGVTDRSGRQHYRPTATAISERCPPAQRWP